MIAEFFIYLIPFKEISKYKSTRYQQKRTPRKVLFVSIVILSKNVLSAAVAIQSNIASLVFLGQLCIAYLYATKVARAILIAHRQFS